MGKYTVIYEPGPRNWPAYVPDLPASIATAKTPRAPQRRIREAIRARQRRIREAIEFHIEGVRLRGETVPEPTIHAGTMSIAAG